MLLFVISNFDFDTFPCSILGQVWYSIVSNPDLCHLSYYDARVFKMNSSSP